MGADLKLGFQVFVETDSFPPVFPYSEGTAQRPASLSKKGQVVNISGFVGQEAKSVLCKYLSTERENKFPQVFKKTIIVIIQNDNNYAFCFL